MSAYFASRPPGRLGLEFAILRLTGVKWDVEPWTPVDSILWGKMVTRQLSANASHDARRLSLLRFVGKGRMDRWYTPYRDDMPLTVSAEELALMAIVLRNEKPVYYDAETDTLSTRQALVGG